MHAISSSTCCRFAFITALALPGHALGQDLPVLEFPPDDLGASTLEDRGAFQLRASRNFEIFVGFRFTDQVMGSGIGFEHESVDDSLKSWMPVHYDHGNGVAIADVDGDDRSDVYFTSQLGGNRLYRNLGNGRFEDITQAAGVGFEQRIGVTASFGDIDNDGDPDLFVTSVRTGNALLLNDGSGHFKDVTATSGLSYEGHSSGATFFDFDNDGLLDLFVANVGVYTTQETGRGGFFRGIEDAFKGHLYPDRAERSTLYRNLGHGRFEDVSVAMGLVDTSWSGDATIVDFNHDDYPDLYVLNMQGDDHYYENQGGKRFVERTGEFFPKTSWGAMGVKFFDYNNDGRADLIVTDMHSDMHDETVNPLLDEKKKFNLPLQDGENNIQGNSFYEQQADGTFLEISDLILTENYWPWGVSVGDLNADGWEDVLITSSMNFPFRYAINSVLMNNAGKNFLDSEFVLGVEPRRDGRTRRELFDLDCSGVDTSHQLCEGRQGAVRVSGSLGTRAAAILDLDGDGDLDIITNEFNDVPQILISDLSAQKEIHFLKVRLVGARSNRDGLGASVTVHTPSGSFTRFHDGKSGYLVQSSLPLYFGLGAESEITRVEVSWPSGSKQIVEAGLEANTLLTVEEPPSDPGD